MVASYSAQLVVVLVGVDGLHFEFGIFLLVRTYLVPVMSVHPAHVQHPTYHPFPFYPSDPDCRSIACTVRLRYRADPWTPG